MRQRLRSRGAFPMARWTAGAFTPLRRGHRRYMEMRKALRRTAVIAIIALSALAGLSAHGYHHGYHGRPSAPRGEWFSLGFGVGTDVLTAGFGTENEPMTFPCLAIDAEFGIFPQRATHNVIMRFTFGLLQERDLFGRPVEGGTLDAVAMYRYQHSSGLAIGIGGGVYYPGFAEGSSMAGEAVIEPSFAFNLNPQNAALSMGTFRLSVPVGIRHDSLSGSWYLNVGIHAVIYII